MQTHFTLAQLADPDIREADKILRACVHCGFCTATCPTYALLGDELDSPRGRIYLIKEMLENDRPADAETVKHIDRCLTCLSCMTTCPSGVHYMHLVDHARHRIEQTYVRPLHDRLMRRLLGIVLPRPDLFRLALVLSRLAKPFGFLLPQQAEGGAGAGAQKTARALGARRPECVPGRGRAPPPRRPDGRLRAKNAVAADQRGHDPPADAAWLRRRGRQGVGLLRRADPSSRPGRPQPSRAPISRPGPAK